MHFKTSAPALVSYFRTGTGGGAALLTDVLADFTPLDGHSANIMEAGTVSGLTNQGDQAAWNKPFYGPTYSWGVGASGGAAFFNMDDTSTTGADSVNQLWARTASALAAAAPLPPGAFYAFAFFLLHFVRVARAR